MRTSWVFMSVTLAAPTDSETCAASAGRAYSVRCTGAPRAVTEIVVRSVTVIEKATRAIDLNGSLAAAWKAMEKAGCKRIQSADIA